MPSVLHSLRVVYCIANTVVVLECISMFSVSVAVHLCYVSVNAGMNDCLFSYSLFACIHVSVCIPTTVHENIDLRILMNARNFEESLPYVIFDLALGKLRPILHSPHAFAHPKCNRADMKTNKFRASGIDQD